MQTWPGSQVIFEWSKTKPNFQSKPPLSRQEKSQLWLHSVNQPHVVSCGNQDAAYASALEARGHVERNQVTSAVLAGEDPLSLSAGEVDFCGCSGLPD